MKTTSAAIVTIETISSSLQFISFLDLYLLQNVVFRVSQQRGAPSGTHTNFLFEKYKSRLYDIDIVVTTKMNTRSLIVGQNLARNSQCFHTKPNQSTRIL